MKYLMNFKMSQYYYRIHIKTNMTLNKDFIKMTKYQINDILKIA